VSARVLFVGLDAAEPTRLHERMAVGALPSLDGLASTGASGSLANCMLTLPGAVWPEIASGVSCGRLPRFFHPRQIVTGEAAPRPLTAADVADDPTFWATASEQGRRVAVVDIPHAPLARELNGLHIVEYGLHDSHFGAASTPAGLLPGLRDRHGSYPVGSCDHYGGSTAARLRLLSDILEGLERKTALLEDLIQRESWDLFACAFSEAHCGGHWFWHYTDASHWCYDPDAPQVLRDAVDTIYARLDAAVGRLSEAAGAETVIVLASHGMAPYVAGYQLLPEVLARLGMCSGTQPGRSALRDLQHTAKHLIPRRYWERLGRLLVEHRLARAALRPLQRRSGALFFPLEVPEARAAYVPNNTIGAIRLNLRGREPYGSVEPGVDASALIEEIRRELLALRQPATGQPIVRAVITAEEAFGTDHHPDVPDLIVQFRQDLGLLDSCESPRVNRVHVPVGSRWGRRTGDHSPRSSAWIRGPGFPARIPLRAGSLLDIAPTVLEALGCRPPSMLDGTPLQITPAAPIRRSP
jgi:predicted AlkP superfamily phosphohydrolase/phosphomutase